MFDTLASLMHLSSCFEIDMYVCDVHIAFANAMGAACYYGKQDIFACMQFKLDCREGGVVEEYILNNAVSNPDHVPELFSLELLTMV